MQQMGRVPDYLTYNELIRALGKGGALPQALQLFEVMCSKPRLLPEHRAFNSMYDEVPARDGGRPEALAGARRRIGAPLP